MVLPGESNSHYCVLGVGKNASEEEIRISYKKLAMKFHPDRNQPSLATDEKCGFIDGVREDSTRMFQKARQNFSYARVHYLIPIRTKGHKVGQ